MRIFAYTSRTISIRKIISSTLALALGMTLLGTSPCLSQPQKQLHMPASLASPQPAPAPGYEDDTLLIMPAASADQDEINDALKEVHGRIVATIGDGKLKVLVVRTEKGKLAETEQKLGKDKHFSAIQRNYRAYAQGVPGNTHIYFNPKALPAPVNDPNFNQEWYLGALHAAQAWQTSRGGGIQIGVFDSGCNFVDDLLTKMNTGFDSTSPADQQAPGAWVEGQGGSYLNDYIDSILPHNKGGYIDFLGHGTKVATTASARADNGVNTAGVAPDALVTPVRIATPDGRGGATTTDLAIMLGIQYAKRFGIKLVNISYNAAPPYSYSNAKVHRVVHAFIQDFHDNWNGLVFVSAGNNGMQDTSPMAPYMIVVSAIDSTFAPVNVPGWWATTYGNPVWFCAPGLNIACSDKDGSLVSVAGTSFAAPICAGVAALVWGANPGLRNYQVESIMKASCKQLGITPQPVGNQNQGGPVWSPFFGYGLPDADQAVRMARGI